MNKWLKRLGLGIVALILLVIAGGAVFEQIARRNTAQEFPPLGKLVDIGGRRIQIECHGTGSPTVVFEAGLDNGGSLAWEDVPEKIATTTRACSYSRAGIMWSDPGPSPRDGKAVAQDLHAVLQKAGERAPFVLVAHSMGGPYIVTYTQMYSTDVAGLVLVDSSHPDQVRRMEAITHRPDTSVPAEMKLLARLSWTGLLRLLNGTPALDQPKIVRTMVGYLPQSVSGMLQEAAAKSQTLADAGGAHALGARPLIVLTALKPDTLGGTSEAEDKALAQDWKAMHDDMATWSSNSKHIPVPDSGHRIQAEKPQIVIDAIKSVVTAVRGGGRVN